MSVIKHKVAMIINGISVFFLVCVKPAHTLSTNYSVTVVVLGLL